jgi:hypothetical protein
MKYRLKNAMYVEINIAKIKQGHAEAYMFEKSSSFFIIFWFHWHTSQIQILMPLILETIISQCPLYTGTPPVVPKFLGTILLGPVQNAFWEQFFWDQWRRLALLPPTIYRQKEKV